MKTTPSLITLCVGMVISAMPGRADVDGAKERAAIKAVIEEEKNAYVALDAARMAATWIQQPTSLKLFIADGIASRDDGFETIHRNDQANLQHERASAVRSTFEFSNYRITVQGDSAWVTHDARWEGVSGGAPATATQLRVCVLRKDDGRWKLGLMAITVLTHDKKR